MTPEDDKLADRKADKRKDKVAAKPEAGGPRQLTRAELEHLRQQLQKKFHRS